MLLCRTVTCIELYCLAQKFSHLLHALHILCVHILFTQHPPHVTRAAGYDVEPLRIDMVADIEHAR